MTINIAKPVRHSTDPDLFGGPNGQTDDLLLTDGGKFLLSDGNDDKLQQATADDILLSPFNCNDNLLQSGGTDLILISGGTDELLISGYCTSSLLIGGKFIIRSS